MLGIVTQCGDCGKLVCASLYVVYLKKHAVGLDDSNQDEWTAGGAAVDGILGTCERAVSSSTTAGLSSGI
jgi:hypothetical protein